MRKDGHPVEPEKGEVYVTQAQSEEYSDRMSIVRIVEEVDPEHPDVVAETIASWNPDRIGSVSSVSESAFTHRIRETGDGQ